MNQPQNIPSAPSQTTALPQTGNTIGTSTYSGGQPNNDLITLIRAVRLMWKHKGWIILGTFVCTAIGVISALVAAPVYTSTAIIAPKETKDMSGMAGMLAQMGDAGSMLASQMGVGGTTVEKMVIIAKSHDLAEAVISHYNLLPLLFHKQYDFKNNHWKIKDPKKIPTIKRGGAILKKGIFSVSTDVKKIAITLRVSIYDSVLAAKIVNYYLVELDNKIRGDVIGEAKIRRAYLDAQMKSTADPWVMQKLQALVGMEMEKSMMVAGSSFLVLETPMVPLKKSKPKRRVIVMLSLFLGFCASGSAILLWDFFTKRKTHYLSLLHKSLHGATGT